MKDVFYLVVETSGYVDEGEYVNYHGLYDNVEDAIARANSVYDNSGMEDYYDVDYMELKLGDF